MKKKILTVTLNPAIDHTVEVPHFAVDKVNRASSSRRDPGGKGINVATALVQGGFDVAVSGFLGKENSPIFQKHFKLNSLDDHFIYVDGSTREGIKVADPVNQLTTDINFPGFIVDEETLDLFIRQFRDLVSSCGFVVLSGSLPRGVKSSIYGELARIACDSGAFVAVDTSGEALKLAVESGAVNLIKPNIDELAEIYDEVKKAENREDAAGKLSLQLLGKVDMIALSLGGEGSRLFEKNRILDATAPSIKVKSTVGAGDTFLAGFTGALASGKNSAEALKQAASWAASKLTMYGSGLSDEQTPESFLGGIEITERN